MHNILAMQVSNSLADVSEILADLDFGYCFHFDLVKECSSFGIFQHHIGDLPLSVHMDVDEFDDFGVGEAVVHHNFVFCDFIDLS